jgi:hypothetical protein
MGRIFNVWTQMSWNCFGSNGSPDWTHGNDVSSKDRRRNTFSGKARVHSHSQPSY